MAAATEGALVELIEYVPTLSVLNELPCIKPRRLLINGTDVGLIKKGSITISEGDDEEPASVTVTLYPKTIILSAEIG